jgi:branched-chain amino acid aminotransferase
MVNGKIPLWSYHAERIHRTLKMLHFDAPHYFTADHILNIIHELSLKNQHQKCGRIRVTIFRGEGGIYDPVNHRPELLIQSWPLNPQNNSLNENGLILGFYQDAFKAADSFANLKTNNYLLYAMAALHVKKSQWNDALIFNHHGSIADATIANCWLVKDGVIKTPPLTDGPVAGVMRQFLIDKLESNGFNVNETSILPEDVMNADECFLTNAIYGIRWVGGIENKRYINSTAIAIFNEVIEPLVGSTL